MKESLKTITDMNRRERAIFAPLIVMTLLLGSTLFASAAFLPVMMQQLFGYSATHAGYVSMPRGYGSLLAFLCAPYLIGKIGARTTMLIGIAISTVSLWQMGHFALVMDESSLEISGFLQGAGSGLAFNPMSVLTPGIFRQIFEFRGPAPDPVSSTSDFDVAVPAR